MKTRMIAAVIAAVMMTVFLGSGAFAAPKLTVESASIAPGYSGTFNITADNAAGITGAAFTLVYDTEMLDITVTSDFFQTFTEQGFGPAEGLDANGRVDGYDSPLVTNEVSGKGMLIAAANAGPAAEGTDIVLFTLNVGVSETAKAGESYAISIVPTTLNNPAAGYDSAGEQIDLLIEAKADGTFASLLTAEEAAANVTKGIITVGTQPGIGKIAKD